MQSNRVCDKCNRTFATSQARAGHHKFCGVPKRPSPPLPEPSDGGFSEMCRELEPIVKKLAGIEQRGTKRKTPDHNTVVDMANAKKCIAQLEASVAALSKHVQDRIDAAQESVEEAVKALYALQAANKRPRIAEENKE